MNTHHRLARLTAPAVNKITVVALVAALMVALLTIAMTGERTQAAEENVLTVNPSEVGFGGIEVGTSADARTITIKNPDSSNESITIGGIQLGGAGAGPFSATPQVLIPPTGLTLAPGEDLKVDVGFSPTGVITDPQNFLSEVRIIEQNTNEVLKTVQVAGTALPPGTVPNSQPGAQPDCTITGTNQDEPLTGTPLADVICGLGGNDRINGLGGNDVMRGGTGNDRIMDKAGVDKLFGQGGKDTLNAKDKGRGDVLKGGGGKDRIVKDKKDRGR